MGRYKKILVAIDGSESSLHALRGTCRLANFEECHITVVGVVPSQNPTLSGTGVDRAVIRQPHVLGSFLNSFLQDISHQFSFF
jgi:nucleotide-binding universal stress UspA family protein